MDKLGSLGALFLFNLSRLIVNCMVILPPTPSSIKRITKAIEPEKFIFEQGKRLSLRPMPAESGLLPA